MKSKHSYLIIIILIFSLSGYFIAYIQYSNNLELQQELLTAKMDRINEIDGSILSIRDKSKITLEELKHSKLILDALIKESEKMDTANLTLDEALKIIGGL